MLKQKNSLSSIDISVLCRELNEHLKDYYIENIYQPDVSTLLLKLNKPNAPVKQLIIESGRRVHLTSYSIRRPSKPPVFCSALRKHLLNGRIKKVEQPNFERIIIFQILKSRESFQLVTELFGEGNIILIDGEERILQALSFRKMKDRQIVRGEKFKLPPPSSLNPEKIVFEDLVKQLDGSKKEVVRVLSRVLGIGGVYTEEVLKIAGVEKTLACSELNEVDFKKIYEAVTYLLEKRNNVQPCIVFSSLDEPIDVLPFPLQLYEGFKINYYPTFNEALDEYFTRIVVKEEVKQREEKIKFQLEEQKRILDEQLNKLKELEEIEHKNKLIG
ncbi:hypothetical protein DRO26_04845, partial [Candidatus Bathyarchaeota archaeon]